MIDDLSIMKALYTYLMEHKDNLGVQGIYVQLPDKPIAPYITVEPGEFVMGPRGAEGDRRALLKITLTGISRQKGMTEVSQIGQRTKDRLHNLSLPLQGENAHIRFFVKARNFSLMSDGLTRKCALCVDAFLRF